MTNIPLLTKFIRGNVIILLRQGFCPLVAPAPAVNDDGALCPQLLAGSPNLQDEGDEGRLLVWHPRGRPPCKPHVCHLPHQVVLQVLELHVGYHELLPHVTGLKGHLPDTHTVMQCEHILSHIKKKEPRKYQD